MGTIENKLKAMGYTLPPPFTFPRTNRTGCTQIGNLLLLSGHGLDLPKLPGVRQAGKFGVDISVERGRGYVSAERNKRSTTIGVIPVDSIFSPVRRVAFNVEPTRVEQATNYDRLTLDIETDGSISPKEALASAGETLRNLVGLLAELSSVPRGLELGDTAVGGSTSLDLDLPIEELDLSERPRNCLKRAQIDTIGQLVERTEDDLLAITNFGQKSLEEVVQKLDERGLSLRVKE